VRKIAIPALALLLFSATTLRAGTLDQDFANPPTIAHPFVWWHWMSSDISVSGIDKDLAAMKQMGVAGVTVCPVGSTTGINNTVIQNSPWPDVEYLGPKWWALMRHATQRAGQLGLDIGMHNCAGWSASGGPWITPELSMQKLVWSQTPVTGPSQFSSNVDQPDVDPKYNFYRDVAVLAVPGTSNVQSKDVLDLTKKMNPQGVLTWTVPPGNWTIYRFGHTTTGKTPHPMPDGFHALECDKLSSHAAQVHLQHVIDAVHQYLPQPEFKAFDHILFDSYEAGPQNWTEDFRRQFINLRGYDPIPWLPVIAGKNIGGNLSQRFQYDMAQTIADLFERNNFAVFHKMLQNAGLRMCFEPYKGPFDTISAAADCDTPMGEFWSHLHKGVLRAVPAAAQALGRTIVGAESFTGNPIVSQWTETPAFLKPVADGAICSGVNQFYLHEWTLQPFDDNIKPGMTAGWWGTHFGRNQTWFTQGKPFFDYLARCAAVLQHGQVVSDFCTLEFATDNGDALSFQLFQQCQVQDHQIVAPSGRRYSLLVLPPDSTRMLPEVAAKLKSLVAAGACILGPRPTASPSLSNYPDCDSQVSAIASELWGDKSDPQLHEHDFGKGKVFWNLPIPDALANIGIPPDFQSPDLQPTQLGVIHRRDVDTDIYFLADLDDHPIDFPASFRVAGKVPELWFPYDGRQQIAGTWRQVANRTELPLSLGPNQSVFVIFRQPANADHVIAITPPAQLFARHLLSATPGTYQLQYSSSKTESVIVPPLPPPLNLSGKWMLQFAGNFGAPTPMTLDHLQSWTNLPDPNAKYFSGSATYSQDFQVSKDFLAPNQRLILDLGDLRDIATVHLNGQDLGILWNPPFRADVSDAVKPGSNHLEIIITNTWRNRLIGDEQQPPDIQWGATAIYNRKSPEGRPLVAFPQWLIAGTTRPSVGRYTFTTWNYFNSTSTLETSGLLGPVTLRVESDIILPDH